MSRKSAELSARHRQTASQGEQLVGSAVVPGLPAVPG